MKLNGGRTCDVYYWKGTSRNRKGLVELADGNRLFPIVKEKVGNATFYCLHPELVTLGDQLNAIGELKAGGDYNKLVVTDQSVSSLDLSFRHLNEVSQKAIDISNKTDEGLSKIVSFVISSIITRLTKNIKKYK